MIDKEPTPIDDAAKAEPFSTITDPSEEVEN